MSGETKAQISGWSVDTLKEYADRRIDQSERLLQGADAAAELRNDQRFTAQQQAIKDALIAQKEAVAAALAAAEKAVLVAEQNAEKWRAASNEWRAAMNDRERILMPRLEAEQGLKSVSDGLKLLSSRVEKSEGRREGLMIIFAVVAAIATVITVFMTLRR